MSRLAAWVHRLPTEDLIEVTGSTALLAQVRARQPDRFDVDDERLWVSSTPEDARRYALQVADRHRRETDDPDAERVVAMCDDLAAMIAHHFGQSSN